MGNITFMSLCERDGSADVDEILDSSFDVESLRIQQNRRENAINTSILTANPTAVVVPIDGDRLSESDQQQILSSNPSVSVGKQMKQKEVQPRSPASVGIDNKRSATKKIPDIAPTGDPQKYIASKSEKPLQVHERSDLVKHWSEKLLGALTKGHNTKNWRRQGDTGSDTDSEESTSWFSQEQQTSGQKSTRLRRGISIGQGSQRAKSQVFGKKTRKLW